MVERSAVGLSAQYQKYILSGFMSVQKTVDTWAFNVTGASNAQAANVYCRTKPDPFIMPFPSAAFKLNPFYGRVRYLP